MITLDTLRSALMTSDPYDGIDRLIRAEQAAGHKIKAIYDELIPLIEEVRNTPGYTEDAEEALMGVLDALSGFCHPDCQYKDAETTDPSTPPARSNPPA